MIDSGEFPPGFKKTEVQLPVLYRRGTARQSAGLDRPMIRCL